MSATDWNDWLTNSVFRVRISLRAAERLRSLVVPTQVMIRAIIEDIADLAALSTEEQQQTWNVSFNRPLLEFRADGVSVRYRIDEEARTLSVEHVVAADEAPERLGDVG